MTDFHWQECLDPLLMLEFLTGKASDRKLRLFACACCRQPGVWRRLDRDSQLAVVTCEDFADGNRTPDQLWRAMIDAPPRTFMDRPWDVGPGVRLRLQDQVEQSVQATANPSAWEAAQTTSRLLVNLVSASEQCALLREVFGNATEPVVPDRLCVPPSVVSFAQAIYDRRSFDRVPELAGVLREARCDEKVIAHCAAPGTHVRGCWAIDAVLNRR